MSGCRFWIAASLLILAAGRVQAAGLDPAVVAKAVDEHLAKEMFGGAESSAATPVPLADDPTFLRRAALDLVGYPPTPEEITALTLDNAPGKRSAAVDRLLTSKQFGENWARYWRDAIMYRRSEDRALLASPALVRFLTQAFNDDPHWDKIASKFITATGDVQEEGATGLIMAQMGNTEDTTAEISRIFMGIQIQCAQCHNHPTDRWKREQFHELAAFFPRVTVRALKKKDDKRSFEVVAMNRERPVKKPDAPKRGSLEHHMPDLKHPDEDGKLMKPVFFVTGQKLEMGLSDEQRREKVAEWITARGNHWFAKAFVNRMWAELVGHGFYEPVDDLGPDRKCAAPHTFDYLADRFAASQYDVKWLMRVITSTEAYQRESRARAEMGEAPFDASCPQRLRADQLFNALTEVLGIEEDTAEMRKGEYKRPGQQGPRGRVNLTFGYDPSVRRDEVAGSIPQALFLMNSPELSKALNGRQPATSLGQLVSQQPKDEVVIEELYLRALAREPKQTELQTCLDHVRTCENRSDAFEDILWSLVNSTEFLNRK